MAEPTAQAFIQKAAPTFTATGVFPGGEFRDVKLEDFKGKWVILLFYPMDFTFVCPTEILAFNDALPRLSALDATVLAISTDSAFAHHAWTQLPRASGGLGSDLKLPLLADPTHAISKAYGVLLPEQGVALRGLFVIDPKGVLRQITVNDLPVGRDVDETVRLLEAFRFTDEFGEVCPAGWMKGQKGLKADPVGKLEYFGAKNAEVKNRHKDVVMRNGVENGDSKKRVRVE